MPENEVSWQAPPFEADDKTKLGFLKRAIEFGSRWNEDHVDQTSLQKGMDILAGKTGGSLSSKWSNFTTGDLKREIGRAHV